MNIIQGWIIFLAAAAASSGFGYEKATEGSIIIKKKLYPKKGSVELSLPNVGLIMNQSYIKSTLIGGGIAYHSSEEWGFGIDVAVSQNSDKEERYCVENFYLDSDDAVAKPCGEPGNLPSDTDKYRYGPAYPPIREINSLLSLNMVWSPVYGKQLFFLSATSYFDFIIQIGAGLANSTYYSKRTTLANGNVSRQDADPNGKYVNTGATPSQTDSYGVQGRPAPESQSHVMTHLSVGQKLHFGKMFNIKVELKNYTLLGTPGGFENYIALMGGAGFRF